MKLKKTIVMAMVSAGLFVGLAPVAEAHTCPDHREHFVNAAGKHHCRNK